ncbi:putative zinc finger, BED-type containing protein [Tanacetum coccineum]
MDIFDVSKNAILLFGILDKMVEEVGEENVVQVVTDNAAAYVKALLEAARKHLYWTPCAAHCLDLMLEDIDKQIPRVKSCLKMAMFANGYIYNFVGLVNLMRKFTNQRNLHRPAITRFATSFITLLQIYKQKDNLRKMITSQECFPNRDDLYKKTIEIIDNRLSPNTDFEDDVNRELVAYETVIGHFGRAVAIRQRKNMAPAYNVFRLIADWWIAYGASTPNLQKFAIKVLSLTCSATSSERNWSDFQHLHKRRYNKEGNADPIILSEFDDSNKWLMGRMEDVTPPKSNDNGTERESWVGADVAVSSAVTTTFSLSDSAKLIRSDSTRFGKTAISHSSGGDEIPSN